MLGVFAQFADQANESLGTLGGSIQVRDARDTLLRLDLVNGKHYKCATELQPWHSLPGDGTSVESVGKTVLDDVEYRVDLLSIDVPDGPTPTAVWFRDLGSPASFAVFEVYFETVPIEGCPFHSQAGGVSLSELGSVLRVGDRVKFAKAISQLDRSLSMAEDLDEARGEALTFLAVVTAATLELGGSRAMHKAQLEAARCLDGLQSIEEIISETRARTEGIAPWLFENPAGPNTALMNRAMNIVERHYAKPLTDAEIANQIGLSTSHFRFLFKQTTGQPFHKYLVSVRLEKARRMLVEQGLPVSHVAEAVGFAGLSHFSRAFSQRFMVSPNSVRKVGT